MKTASGLHQRKDLRRVLPGVQQLSKGSRHGAAWTVPSQVQALAAQCRRRHDSARAVVQAVLATLHARSLGIHGHRVRSGHIIQKHTV